MNNSGYDFKAMEILDEMEFDLDWYHSQEEEPEPSKFSYMNDCNGYIILVDGEPMIVEDVLLILNLMHDSGEKFRQIINLYGEQS